MGKGIGRAEASRVFLLLASLIVAPPHAGAGERFDFARIWAKAKEASPDIEAAEQESRGARSGADRLARHWFPKLSAEGRAFSTNSPVLGFMSVLGQRQISAADFAPAALNHPAASLYGQGSLVLDMPLFEGGARVAAAGAAAKSADAASWRSAATKGSLYAELAVAYASMISLKSQQARLGELEKDVSAVLSRYEVGSRSNPVGYSGLLGIKSLRNRIAGLMVENEARLRASRERIALLAGLSSQDWEPSEEPVPAFLRKVLPVATTPAAEGAPVRAARAAADALDERKSAETARFLPQVGLFAQGDMYSGKRDTATGYTAGAYVRWELFNATSYGARSQAEHEAAAARARAEALGRRARADGGNAALASEAIEKNLALLDENAAMQAEQSAAAQRLFRSGAINALQLVEVMSRRVDLAVHRLEAETSLSQARAALFMSSFQDEVPHG